MSYKVRSIASLRDVNQLVHIHNIIWNNSSGIIDLLEHSSDCLLLVDSHQPDQVLGYLFVEWDAAAGFAEINDLAIHPQERGKGGGRFLMAQIMEQYGFIKLNASAKDKKLINFYQKLGFETESVFENYYAIDNDALRMIWKKK
jgi:ribosomal protein S18 acetylase RimI-like enzyme